MNNTLYRIIFNQARGQWMAVQETARGQGKPTSGRNSVLARPAERCSLSAAIKLIAFLTLQGLGAAAFAADIIAAPNATAEQRPTVDQAANGRPVVQIAAPSGAGVSYNQYQQFNVPSGGAILNNSATLVQTQLAGFIDGNRNLADGPARIILNEVTHPTPSQLNGYLEVAGQRAEVVIANPWGITCRGCGFINADRATLTTGVPEMTNGTLTGYRVESGSVRIDGQGLNASNLDSFTIITRAMEVNSDLQAKALNIVLGRNQVDKATLTITPLAPDATTAPEFALDVSHLGGMYAGAITLVGTEKGVGVNSQGQIAVTDGVLTLNSTGDLRLAGKTSASGDAYLTAGTALALSGSLVAGQNLALTAQAIQVAQGAVVATGVNEDSSLKDGVTLRAATSSLENAGQWLTGGLLEVETDTLANTGGTLAAKNLNLVSHAHLDNREHGQIIATGNASLKTAALLNVDSLIGANGTLSINTATLGNDQGTLQAQTLDVQASLSLSNAAGQIHADWLSLTTAELTNVRGTLSMASEGRLNTTVFTNTGGTVQSGTSLSWSGTTLSNRDQGVIHAIGSLTLDGNLDNRSGEVSSQQRLTLHGSLDNQAAGQIRAAADLIITGADQVSNLGSLSAGSAIDVAATHLGNQGVIGAGLDSDGSWLNSASLTLTTTGQQHNTGTLLASGELFLHGGNLILSGQTLALGASRLRADEKLTQQGGSLESGGQLTLEGQHIALSNTTLSGHAGTTLAATQTLTSSQTTLLTNGQLNASADSLTLDATTTWHTGQQADLHASSLALQAGSVLKSDSSLQLTGESVSLAGQVHSEDDLRIDGDVLALNGETGSAGALTVQTRQLSATGQTTAKGTLTITAEDLAVSQTAQLASQSTLQLSTLGHFDNQATLQGQEIHIDAAGLTQQGIVAAANDLTIRVDDTLTNTSGHVLFAGRNQNLYARHLVNQEDATIWAGQDLVIQRNAAGDRADSLSNTLGRIEAWQGDLTLRAQQIDNTGRDPSSGLATRGLPGSSSYEGWSGTMWAGNNAQQASGFLERWRPYIPQQYWSELPNYSYDRIDYYLVNSWEQYLPASFTAKPAEMLAGGNMTIDTGQLNNRYSQIEAGDNLTLTADRVTNTGLGLTRYIQIVREYERASCPTCASWPGANQYTTIFAGNVDSPLSVKSTIKAGGTLTLNVGTLDNANGGEALQNQAYAVRPELAGNVNVTVAEGGLLQQSAIPQDAGFGIVLNGQGSLNLDQLALPAGQNGLFVANPGGSHGYLIETNPAFASYKNFISSDYMLSRLGYDPSQLPLRLGDAWFENQLIESQLLGLTGSRQIADSYQGLMDNALALQKQLALTPGQRLSAEQAARLDRDIVWMEERTVNGQTVLVPQIYLASATRATLTPDGAIVAGADVVLNADIVNNQGALTANKTLLVQADSLANTNGLLQGSDRLTVITDNTLSSKGGLIRGGQVGLQAGTDLTLDATALQSSGDTTLIAQDGNVSMGTVGTDYHYTGVTRVHKGTQTWTTEGTQQHTTQAAVGGKLAIQAKNDIITQGAELAIQGTAQLVAGRDIMLGATEDRYHDFSHTNVTSKSLVSSSQKLTDIDDQGTRVKGSTLSADSATLLASRDITLAASNVASTGNVDLQAGRDIDITTVTETTNYNYHHSERSSGLSGTGGVGVSIGTSRSQDDSKDQNVLAMGSTLGSVKGSVTVQAGQDVTIKGSDIIAGQNIDITGQNVTVTSAAQRLQHEETHERSKSGITLALSGAVGDAVNATVQSAQQAQQSSNGRLAALQGVKAGLTGFQAWQQYQLQAAQPEGKQNLYGISLSLGNQQSSSHSQSVQTQALASELNAGDNLSVRATGSGGNQQGDLTITGSSLKGGKDISLIANHDLTLQAARNESDLNGSNTSSGWNVGISVGVGSGGGGLSIFANANKGKGKENGDADQYTEAVVSAGQTLTLQSGRDTTLTGAQASGSTIQAEVGRNLTLASQQDHDHFDSKQGNVSIGGSYTFGTGSASASLSVSKQTIRSDFDSVVEQTGFYAGQGGFDITVGEHTQLDGAVLASTADAGRNRLSTDTLGWRNLENQARFQVENQGVGISLGTDLKQSLQTSAAGSAASTLLGGQGASDSDRSTTFAAISDGSIEIRGNDRQGQDVATLSRDAEHAANGLSPIFDKQKELDRLQVAQLLGEIGAQATQVVVTQMAMPAQLKAAEAARAEAAGDTAGAQRLREQANVLEKAYQAKWGIGSDFQKAAQAATAALQGLAGGNLEAALSGVAAPYLAGMIKDLTTDSNGQVNTGANAMAHAVLGAALAEAKGGSAAAGAVGGATAPLAASLLLAQLYPGKTTEQLSEEEKQTVAALTTLTGTLAGALVAGNSTGAVTAGQTAKNEVENNSLKAIAQQKQALLPPSANKQLIGESLNCTTQSQQVCKQQLDKVMNAYDKATDPKEKAALLQTMEWLKGAAAMGQEPSVLDYALLLVSEGLMDGKLLGKVKELIGRGSLDEANAIINQSSSGGTVWTSITSAGPVYPGSVIPKNFELTLDSGQKIWIDSNATKHIAEYAAAKAKDFTPQAVKLSSQVQLNSLKNAIEQAQINGIKYRQLIKVDEWELVFAPPKTAEQFPALYHAVYKTR